MPKEFLAIGPGCWARATTPADAVKNAAKEGGYSRVSKGPVFRLFKVEPDTRLVFDEWGSMRLQVPEQGPQNARECYVCDTDAQGRVTDVEF